jgi:hypothetical protein
VIGAHEAEDALPADRDPASFPVPAGYGMSPHAPAKPDQHIIFKLAGISNEGGLQVYLKVLKLQRPIHIPRPLAAASRNRGVGYMEIFYSTSAS